MPPRTQSLAEADRHVVWIRLQLGRELRLARHTTGATQQQVAVRLGWSKSKVSRIERGLSPGVSVADLTRLAAVVGLRPSVKFFPTGRPLRDSGQIELLAALNLRMHSSWHSLHEVPMPKPGDLRAADQLSTIPGCRVMVEAYRRFSDYQAQTRSARLKQQEIGAERLVILLEDTRTNRDALSAGGSEVRRSFPVPPRAMLAALGAGRDPGGDGIILLRRAASMPGVSPGATNVERSAAPTPSVLPGATLTVRAAVPSELVAHGATRTAEPM